MFNPALVEQAVYIGMSFLIVLPALFFGDLADTLRRGRPRGSAAPLPLAMLAMLGVLAATVAAAANAFDPLNLQGTTWGDGLANLLFGSTLVGLAAGLTYWGPKDLGPGPQRGARQVERAGPAGRGDPLRGRRDDRWRVRPGAGLAHGNA